MYELLAGHHNIGSQLYRSAEGDVFQRIIYKLLCLEKIVFVLVFVKEVIEIRDAIHKEFGKYIPRTRCCRKTFRTESPVLISLET